MFAFVAFCVELLYYLNDVCGLLDVMCVVYVMCVREVWEVCGVEV